MKQNKMKVYLAGPITGIKNDNREEFSRIKDILQSDKFGYEVVSPFDFTQEPDNKGEITEQALWNYYMRNCLYRLLGNDIELVCLMKGWKQSKGASTEAYVAEKGGIKVVEICENDGKVSFSEIDEEEEEIEDILGEAHKLVYGDRQKSYSHPLNDYTRTAKIWSAILGQEITAEQAILCMIGVKMSRLCHTLKHDSICDLAGYAQCLQRVKLKRAEIENEKNQ